MCGFSEGVVRSWRDGHTDPSRARCVTLARTLGVSLIWLVAGEGALQVDQSAAGNDDSQYNSETIPTRTRNRAGHAQVSMNAITVDPNRLNTAMQILQSELDLANSPMTLAENTDMLSRLYDILGSDGTSVNATAMLQFNRLLSERLRRGKTHEVA